MKKNLFITMSLVLALSLAGCGSKAIEEPKTEPEQEAVVENVAPAPTEVTPEIVEVTLEIVAEEPEAEEAPIEETFAKYDKSEWTGKDVTDAVNEFAYQEIAVCIRPGRLSVVPYMDNTAVNYGVRLDGTEGWTVDFENFKMITYNTESFEGADKDMSPYGHPYSIYKESPESYYTGSIFTEDGKNFYSFTNTGYLKGEMGSGSRGFLKCFIIDDEEPFTSELIKDTNDNVIGILFVSQYTPEEVQSLIVYHAE